MVVKTATPLPLMAALPMAVEPSWKMTLPVGTAFDAVSVAVSVTVAPATILTGLAARLVELVCFTLSDSGDEVLGELFASPA